MRCQIVSLVALIGLGSLSAGCSTPQALLDQANNGAALAMSLQAELQNFRTKQAEIAQARVASIRRQTERMATYEVESAFDERVMRIAGKTKALQLYSNLKELADSRASDEKALNKRLAEIDEELGKLLTPLPDNTAQLKEVQKSLAILGQELSSDERMEIAASFAKIIKKAIDENKEKIEGSSSSTPAGTAQPEAPAKPPGTKEK